MFYGALTLYWETPSGLLFESYTYTLTRAMNTHIDTYFIINMYSLDMVPATEGLFRPNNGTSKTRSTGLIV